MTTFALIHGAYGRGAVWDALAAELEARGHRAVAPDLPCEDPAAGFGDYADAMEDALDGADDVTVVGHSLGGVTAALLTARRPSARVVYLAAILPRPGRPLAEAFAERPPMVLPEVPAAEERAPGGLRRVRQDVADAVLFEGVELRWQAVAPYFEACPLDALPAGPYVVCARDRVVSPEWGRTVGARLAGGGLRELDTGHMAQVEDPAALAEVLVA